MASLWCVAIQPRRPVPAGGPARRYRGQHHRQPARALPGAARIDFIDTIPLARQVVPGLPNYKLDTLLAYFSIGQPADRHRAGADVEVTAQVFFQLIRAADEMPQFSDLAALVKAAGRTAKCNIPAQGQFF